MYLDELLSKVKVISVNNSRVYQAICPAHNDRKASLSITEGRFKDRSVIYCHAGCSAFDIMSSLGLKVSDLYYPTAVYDYGSCKKVRTKDKGFYYSGSCNEDLYNLQGILNSSPHEWIFICEGEKDANSLIELGFVATTDGNRNVDYSVLSGRNVVLLQDNDDVGKKKIEHWKSRINAYKFIIITPEIGGWDKISKGDLSDIALTEQDVLNWINVGDGINKEVVEVKKDPRYFAASSEPFNDKRLSWEAKGLLAYLLTKPNDYIINEWDFIKSGYEEGIDNIIQELQDNGYVVKRKIYDIESGKFNIITTVYDEIR